MDLDRLLDLLPHPVRAEAFRLWASGAVHLRTLGPEVWIASISTESRAMETRWRRPGLEEALAPGALRIRGCGCRSAKPCAHEGAAWLALLFDGGGLPEEAQAELQRLEAQLEPQTAVELLRLARRRRWALPRGRKPELVRRLAARLSVYYRLGLWREELDPELERLLGLIRLLGQERVDPEELEARWMRWAEGDRLTFRAVWRRAIQQGLLIPCALGHDGRPRPHAHLPATLPLSQLPPPVFPATVYRGFPPEQTVAAPPLRPLLEEARRWWVLRPPARILRVHPQAHRFPWLWGWPHDPEEVEALLARHAGSPPPYEWLTVPAEEFDPRAVEALGERMGLPWEGAAFIAEILWRLSGEGSGEAFPFAPGIGEEDPIARWWEIWRSGATRFEIAWLRRRDPTVRLVRSLGWMGGIEQLYYEWGRGRKALIELLATLPDEWVDWMDLARAVEAAQPPGFAQDRLDQPWRLVRGRPAQEPVPIAEHLRAYLEGTLFWLGAVALVYEGGSLRAFRLTAQGRRWIRGEIPGAEEPESLPETQWLDERTWSVRPGPEAAPLLWLSGRIGRPMGSPFVFALDEERIAEVFREGYRPEEILSRFEACGLPPTAALRTALERVWDSMRRVQVFEEVTILEAEDPWTLQELLAATGLGSAIRGWLAPHVVVIEEAALERLLKELRDRGYFPTVVEG